MSARAIPAEGLFNILRNAETSNDSALRRMQMVANLLDTAFVVPGTKQRVGIDAIVGLIPGAGDVLTTLMSTYVIWEARNLGVSRSALMRMFANLGIHATFGSVPVIGDLFDAFFRVNQRNMRIVRAELAKSARA